MAAAFQSQGALTSSVTDTVSPAAPSGVVSGDLLYLLVNATGSGVGTCTFSGLSAWTSVEGTGRTYWNGGGTDIGRAEWYYRIADGTGDDTPAVVCSVTPGFALYGVITRFDGIDTATPVADFAYVADSTSPITCPDVTAAADDSLAVVSGATYVSETGTWTFTNSFTERLATTSGRAHFVATKAVNTGAVGTVDVTNTTTLLRFGVMSIVFNPATAGGLSIPIASYHYNHHLRH